MSDIDVIEKSNNESVKLLTDIDVIEKSNNEPVKLSTDIDVIEKSNNVINNKPNNKFVVFFATYMRANNRTPNNIKNVVNMFKSQTYQNFDIVIIGDDYENNDEFEELMKLFPPEKLVYYENRKESTRYNTFNIAKNRWSCGGFFAKKFGLEKCMELGYKYYFHLDDDDKWDSNHTQIIKDTIEQYPEVDFLYTKSRYCGGVLPNTTVNKIAYNNLPPRSSNLVHSTTCMKIETLAPHILNLFNTRAKLINDIKAKRVAERQIGPFDAWKWDTINNLIKKKSHKAIFIPTITCTKQNDGNVPPSKRVMTTTATSKTSTEATATLSECKLDLSTVWPNVKPNVKPFMHGWFGKCNKKVLDILIPGKKIIVEMGSWYGQSIEYILSIADKDAKIYSIDRWDNEFIKQMWRNRGKDYKPNVGFIDQHPLYDTFLVNFWDHKDRLTPIRGDTVYGMKVLVDKGIVPDLIYIDAGHEYETVKKELEYIEQHFPTSKLCGDDICWDGVRRAVEEYAKRNGKKVMKEVNCWYI